MSEFKIMWELALTFIVSLLMIKVIIYTSDIHSQVTLDNDLAGVQKMHEHAVPRIGGLAIFVSMTFTALYGANIGATWAPFYAGLITSLFFVFVGGLTEDLSKAVSPAIRMTFMAAAVMFAVFISHTMPMVRHLAHDNLDLVLSVDVLAFVVTCFAVVGVANSYNIIDGYNGLSSTAAMINSLGLAYLSWCLGDMTLVVVAISFTAAVFGFWVYNYPRGKIFLGDGGAYSIGFMVAFISINLVERHVGQISPYAVLLLAAYPITETVFTIIRRKFVHKTKATQPDNLHLHQLVFERCLPRNSQILYRNARVMPLMLIIITPPAVVTLLWYKSSLIMLLGLLGYIAYYTYFYLCLVRFQTPRILTWQAKLLTRKYPQI